jgi:hypothetical protein
VFRLQPFKKNLENIYQEFGLMAILFTYSASVGIYFGEESVLVQQIIQWSVLALNAGVVLFGLVVILKEFLFGIKKTKRDYQRVSLSLSTVN